MPENVLDTQPIKKPNIPKDATVLVVEDNVANFVLIARMLGYLGIHCEWKTSGYEVVEYADTLQRLDLILMDIRLPYEDGYGALKKIRASERLKSIPIIAVTAEASQDQMAKAQASTVFWASRSTRTDSLTRSAAFLQARLFGNSISPKLTQ
jgi:two-component system cell cycle response regulator DivK